MKNSIILLFLLYSAIVNAQTERFFKLYDYNNERNFFQGIIEYNNKYYASGISAKAGTHAFISCVNSRGDLLWKKKFLIDSLNANQTALTRLSVSLDKTLLVSGSVVYTDTSKALGLKVNPFILEMDTNGNILNELFNFEYYDTLNFGQRAYEIQDGKYILGNVSYTEDQREHNPTLILLDSLGNELLRRDYAIFPNKKQVYLNDFIPLSDKGYLMLGYQKAITSSNYNGMLIRVDSNLNVVWKGEYGTSGFEEISSGIQLKDGHLLVCGLKEGLNGIPNNYEAWLMKINVSTGNVIREKTFVFKTANTFRGLTENTDGTIVLAGEVDNLDSLSSNAHIVKLTPQWEIIWSQNYGMPYINGKLTSSENVFGFIHTTDGGFMLVGFSHDRSLEPSTQDAMLLKVDSNGCLVEGCTYTGLEQEQTERQKTLIYPNPAKDLIKVVLTDAAENCNYEIINTLGEIQSKGKLTNTELNIEHLNNGMYLLRLYTEKGILHLKFIKE